MPPRRALLLLIVPGASAPQTVTRWAPPHEVVQPLPQPARPAAPTTPPAALGAAADGRLHGHFPYADSGAAVLVAAPVAFAVGQPCRLQPGAAAALARLLAAKDASGVSGALRGLSCYRSVAHQRAVFCRPGRNCRDAERRARYVAPPGYSEHETGYAIDFAVRPAPGCADASDCIAATPAGRWLLTNGARFGFELSFPQANAQGVSWEPWHWRWVGVDGEAPGAAEARRTFAAARARFPAAPRVAPLKVRVASQPPVPLTALPPPTPAPVVALPKPLKPPKRRHR